MDNSNLDLLGLEKILENFTKTSGLASVAVDENGTPITQEYGFCEYCRLIRATPEGLRRCHASDAAGHGIYQCHAGLFDGGSEITVEGKTLAKIKYGQSQSNCSPLEEDAVRTLAAEIGADGDALWAAAQQVQRSNAEKRDSSVELLSAVMNGIATGLSVQERQQKLFDTIPSGILEFFFETKTKKMRIQAANHTLFEMIGLTEAEFATLPTCYARNFSHPEDYHLIEAAGAGIKVGKGQTFYFRLLNHRTGKYRWVSCNYTIVDKTEDGIRVISAFIDIDDKRRAEDASAAKSLFLSRMSHEIRTPINAILGIAELEKQDAVAGTIDPASLARYTEETTAASEYLLTLVNDILDTSRIENNKLELHDGVVNAKEFIAGLQSLAAPLAKERGVTFELERKTELHEQYLGDAVRAKQIIVNLLNNAFKFTPRGGTVRLVCEAMADTHAETTLRFTVTDTGIGMSEDFQKKLFVPFVQENSGTTSPFAGTGLGLSISKNLAMLMGGDITCHSVQGEGSTFVATIVVGNDIATDAAAATGNPLTDSATPAAAEADFDFNGVRILVCEDHPLNQKITKALLERKHCTVEIADDGEAGVAAFTAGKPGTYAMILMDIRMPKMDGLAAARAIRALENRPDAKTIPIVAMSANAYEEDVQKSLAAGMNDHLAKPVNAARLYRAVQQYTSGNKQPPV